jgi:hypothetical protein
MAMESQCQYILKRIGASSAAGMEFVCRLQLRFVAMVFAKAMKK